jgi:hypothetical protein
MGMHVDRYCKPEDCTALCPGNHSLSTLPMLIPLIQCLHVLVVCIGSFSSRGEFSIYIPARREVQPSRVEDSDLPPDTDDDNTSSATSTSTSSSSKR